MFFKGRKETEDPFANPFGHRSEETGVRRVLAQIFRERELLIRTDGQVRFLRIGARAQMVAAGLFVSGAIWAATAVPVTITQGVSISTNNSQIFEARLAYADLLDEVTEYQATVDAVTEALREGRARLEAQIGEASASEQKLAAAGDALAGPRAAVAQSRHALQQHLDQVNSALVRIANDGEELESMLAKIRSDLAAEDNGRMLVERARARLKERAEGLEQRLSSVVDQNQKVEEVNASLSSEIQVTTAERDGLLDQRAALRSNIQALEAELAELNTVRQNLESRNHELASSLDATRGEAARLAADRMALQEQVAALDGELMLTRSRQDEVKDDLVGVAQSLQAVIGDETVLGESPHTLRTQIDGLLAELTNQQAIEEVVLQRATERAASSIQEIEKIVAMAGLNVDKMLARIANNGIGQGGPFIAASAEMPADDELGETMLSLDSNMSRWESLKELLRALPLSLPVDYYHLTSDFGPRTDPVNKRRSQHHGLDMAGWMKSSIYAAAPGTVVFSGVKGRYGNVVEIDHGFGIRTRYAHLDKNLVQVGDVVGHRQRIALLGSSGRSTGPHLHYEVRYDGRPLDPMNFIKAGRYVFKN